MNRGKWINMVEIERVFIMNHSECATLRTKLQELGFRLCNSEIQFAYYMDFRDFQLFKSKRDFRFRYVFDDQKQFRYTEISMSVRTYTIGKDEMRKQTKLILDTPHIANKLIQMLKGAGMINSFSLYKYREEYSKSGGKEYQKDLHIEIDGKIKMSKYPHWYQYFLEDTFQICIESDQEEKWDAMDGVMSQLGLVKDQITTQNYGERLDYLIQQKGKGERQLNDIVCPICNWNPYKSGTMDEGMYIIDGTTYPITINEKEFSTLSGVIKEWVEIHCCKNCKVEFEIPSGT